MEHKLRVTLSFEAPPEALARLGLTPEAFAVALREAAAMFWYGRTEISLGTAAEIAGMNVRDFMFALSRKKQDIFVVDWDDFDRELAFLAEQRRQETADG